MLKSFDRLRRRLSDPLLTVLTLMLSFLLFVLGPMQAAGDVTGQHFGYFFGLVLLPAAFLYSQNLFVAGPIAVALALVVTAALMEFKQSQRTDLYLDSAAWLIAGLALGVVVARAVFAPGAGHVSPVCRRSPALSHHRADIRGPLRLRRLGGAECVHQSSDASGRLRHCRQSHLLQFRNPDDHRLWRYCAPASVCAQPCQCRSDYRPNLSSDFTGAARNA